MHKCKVNGKSVLEKQIDRQMEASATRSVINKRKYIIVNYENCCLLYTSDAADE